ncbi:hypothetical protein ACLM5J_17355 [Nocardioides sp. Bht2]|uniref:hypothetical protein n=1 Tax=Nocardioides sp. Bht2 TaxID=3392297 RepID=UPI0039B6C68D
MNSPAAEPARRTSSRWWLPLASALSVHLLWLIPFFRDTGVARYSVPGLATLLLLGLAWRLQRADPLPRPLTPIWWSAGIVALVVAGAGWAARDGATQAAAAGAAVLVAGCPAAVLGARGFTVAVTKRAAAQHGITLPRTAALLRMNRIDRVVLDKHRTVTTGSMQITAVEPIDIEHHNNLLFFAGALSHASPTPSPVSAALARRSGRGRITNFQDQEGRLSGSVDRHPVRLGQPEWVGLSTPIRRGVTLGVEVDTRALGLITLDDVVRPHVEERVEELGRYGPITLISDGPRLDTEALAEDVGIDDSVPAADGETRLRVVKSAQDEGKTVCFIGPSSALNAPALDAADLVVTDARPGATHRPNGLNVEPFDLDTIRQALKLSTGLPERLEKVQTVAGAASLGGAALAATGLMNPYLAAVAGLVVLGVTATSAVAQGRAS